MDTVLKIPKFRAGDVVKHRRYEYRGVVVGYDETCLASDDWKRRNTSSSDRDEPWYQVLVHGCTHSTYVAEAYLVPDDSGEQIIHPLVKNYFLRFRRGRYLSREIDSTRNE